MQSRKCIEIWKIILKADTNLLRLWARSGFLQRKSCLLKCPQAFWEPRCRRRCGKLGNSLRLFVFLSSVSASSCPYFQCYQAKGSWLEETSTRECGGGKETASVGPSPHSQWQQAGPRAPTSKASLVLCRLQEQSTWSRQDKGFLN